MSDAVLLVTPRLDGDDGVSEVSRQAVDACISAFGHDRVEVWTFEGDAPASTKWTVHSARGSRTRLAARGVSAAARRSDGLTVVVLHLHLAPVVLPLAARGANCVGFLHGIEAWRPLRPRERASVAAFTRLIANSQWTADRFRVFNPAFTHRQIAVCPLGVGDAPTPEYPDGRGYALIVGRLAADERYKGHDRLIAAWPEVLSAVLDARLVVVGDGSDRGRLEALAVDTGIGERIEFVGHVSRQQLEGFYRNAAFFVMPSTKEGFGLAYLEAMRAGKACIAGSGAPAEVVEHDTTGLVVDPTNHRALIEAVVRLFRDVDLRTRFGRAGRARVAETFTKQHFADRFLAELAVTRDVVIS